MTCLRKISESWVNPDLVTEIYSDDETTDCFISEVGSDDHLLRFVPLEEALYILTMRHPERQDPLPPWMPSPPVTQDDDYEFGVLLRRLGVGGYTPHWDGWFDQHQIAIEFYEEHHRGCGQ